MSRTGSGNRKSGDTGNSNDTRGKTCDREVELQAYSRLYFFMLWVGWVGRTWNPALDCIPLFISDGSYWITRVFQIRAVLHKAWFSFTYFLLERSLSAVKGKIRFYCWTLQYLYFTWQSFLFWKDAYLIFSRGLQERETFILNWSKHPRISAELVRMNRGSAERAKTKSTRISEGFKKCSPALSPSPVSSSWHGILSPFSDKQSQETQPVELILFYCKAMLIESYRSETTNLLPSPTPAW